MTSEELQKYRQETFVSEYRELRKTMKHSKAIHALKDKSNFCYYTVAKLIPKDVVNEFVTTRKMRRKHVLQ